MLFITVAAYAFFVSRGVGVSGGSGDELPQQIAVPGFAATKFVYGMFSELTLGYPLAIFAARPPGALSLSVLSVPSVVRFSAVSEGRGGEYEGYNCLKQS